MGPPGSESLGIFKACEAFWQFHNFHSISQVRGPPTPILQIAGYSVLSTFVDPMGKIASNRYFNLGTPDNWASLVAQW